MPQDRAWDSDALIGWLGEEPDKQPECEPVIRAAEEGKVRIVASALAAAEVIKLRHHVRVPKSEQEKIELFFGNPYVFIRNVDPKTSRLAREIVWSHGIGAKDAVHVATALLHGCEFLDTFDDKLISCSGLEIPGYKRLVIGHPLIPNLQQSFPDVI